MSYAGWRPEQFPLGTRKKAEPSGMSLSQIGRPPVGAKPSDLTCRRAVLWGNSATPALIDKPQTECYKMGHRGGVAEWLKAAVLKTVVP